VTIADAQAELDVLVRRIANEYPPSLRNNADALRMAVQPLREEIAGTVHAPLLMLFAAIGLVLIVACANVANLILSRAAAGERDNGIRAALGATRLRLFQRHAAEAILLTSTGTAVGVVIAGWILDAVPTVVARSVPGLEQATLDFRVLAFGALAAIATGIIFGALPLLTAGGRDLGAVHDGGIRSTPRRQHRLQHGLVVSTVALAFILLVGAGLFVRSFSALMATDPGFRSTGVLSVSLALPLEGYPTAQDIRNFHEAAVERAAGLPGVRSAAVATDLPLESYEMRMYTSERAEVNGSATGSTQLSWVHGPYFETLGLELTDGRLFLPEEHADPRQVVIINEGLANRLWPDGGAVGQRLKWGPPESPAPWLTVVGVVSNVATGPELSAVMRDDRPVHAYEPFRQFPDFFLDNAVSGFGRDVRLAVHTEGDPTALIGPVRRELASLDPQLAIARVALMDELKAERVAPQRFTTALLTTFGGGALLLAAIGLYGILSFTVEQRRREIGVRVALGAQPRRLVRMMVGKGVALAGLGMALGLAGALAMTRLLQAFLYEIDAFDPLTFVAVPLVLAGAALLASALPAFKATRLDPMQALRAE
jgi:predicted permease